MDRIPAAGPLASPPTARGTGSAEGGRSLCPGSRARCREYLGRSVEASNPGACREPRERGRRRPGGAVVAGAAFPIMRGRPPRYRPERRRSDADRPRPCAVAPRARPPDEPARRDRGSAPRDPRGRSRAGRARARVPDRVGARLRRDGRSMHGRRGGPLLGRIDRLAVPHRVPLALAARPRGGTGPRVPPLLHRVHEHVRPGPCVLHGDRAGRTLRLSGPRSGGPAAPRAGTPHPGPARRVRRALGGRRVRAVGGRGGDPGCDVRRGPAPRPADRGPAGRNRIHGGGPDREPRFRPHPAHAALPRQPGLAAPRRGKRAPRPRRAGDVAKPRGVPERGRLPHDARAAAGGLRRAGPHPRGGRGAGWNGAGRPRQPPARPRGRRRPRPRVPHRVRPERAPGAPRVAERARGRVRRWHRALHCPPGGRGPQRGARAPSPPRPRGVAPLPPALLGRRRGGPRSRPSRRASTRCTRSSGTSSRRRPGIGQNRPGQGNETTGESP